MEKRLNPDVHIICGKCGRSTMLEFNIVKELDDGGIEYVDVVYLFCNNCSTVTDLSELIDKKQNYSYQ